MDEFDGIMSEMFGSDHELAKAPAQTRPDGLHYLADIDDTVSVYELQVLSRVVLHVLVDHAKAVEMPQELKGHLHPQATAHAIMVANLDHSVVAPTNGLAIMGKHHLNSDSVRTYVIPRALRFVIQVHGIGV
jgi:hypothetical protein